MKSKLISLLLLLGLAHSLCAKNDKPELATLLIPESLTKKANSVVRDYQTQFVLTDKTKGVETEHIVITVLNEKGLKDANFLIVGDQYRKLKQFSAVTYNSLGKEIKEYKKSEVATSQWSQSLSTDNLNYMWSCPIQPYPFTIVYDYEVEWKNGITDFPLFSPQESSSQTIQQASYSLQVPSGTDILIDGNKFISAPTKSEEQNGAIGYKWELKNILTIEDEALSPPVSELVPFLLIVPKQFYFDGYEGSYESIKSIGEFQNRLNEGRNTLTDATKQKIVELTKDAKSDKEKVKILYDYLGQNTRYESIQLGIGGWQPISSGEVCKNSFGDCKGLTFYLKSMLEAVGIPSNYTVIRMNEEEKELKNNFSSYILSNHVILQVPLPKDTLWLECTAANTVPFGYVHNKIAGHNAIVVTNNGGVFVKLPDYADSLNTSVKQIKIQFNKSEPTAIDVKSNYRLKEYDDVMFLTHSKPNEQIDFVRETVNIPNAAVSQLSLKEEKSATPSLAIDYKILASPYGTSTGNRYFVTLNSFRKNEFKFRRNKRVNDVVIANGWKTSDDIEIVLPKDVEIEYLPTSISFDSAFGSFQSSVKKSDQTIQIKQQLLIHQGRWSADKYKELVDFLEKVTNVYNDAIVVKNK